MTSNTSAGLDAEFREPHSADPALFVFNTASNWIGGRVPDGTATISARIAPQFQQPVTFSRATTNLGAINLTGVLPLQVMAGQTLELKGAGFVLLSTGIVFRGAVRGHAVLRSLDPAHFGYLSGPVLESVGTFEGSVDNISGSVFSGRGNNFGSDTMTIQGNYQQGHEDPVPQPKYPTLWNAVDAKGLSLLRVVGRADLLPDASLAFVVMEGEVPPLDREVAVLTATAGLHGIFDHVSIGPPYRVSSLRYDDNGAYAILSMIAN